MTSKEITLTLTEHEYNQLFLSMNARIVDVEKRIKGDTSAWIGNIPELKRKLAEAWDAS